MKRILLATVSALTAVCSAAMDQQLSDQIRQRADNRGKERQWLYYETRNRMTDEVTETSAELEPSKKRWAVITVDNQISGVAASITYLAGKLDCQAMCTVLVRADDAQPRTFAVRHGGENVYMQDSKAFIDYVRNARRILVQMRFTTDPDNHVKGPVIAEYNTDTSLEIKPLRAGIKPQ